MQRKDTKPDPEQQAQILAELRRDRELRQAGYRERALKVLPHICARCAREFAGKRLKELTVHHKDHNFKNNPPDGRNWELLCEVCHEEEHAERTYKPASSQPTIFDSTDPSTIASPFEALDDLLKSKPKDKDSNAR